MWLSAVAAGEFEVRQSVADLPLRSFRIQPYNLPHAIRAAAMFRAVREDSSAAGESRRIIINDLKILAQAEEEGIPVILTEDRNTLSRLTGRLRQRGLTSVSVRLLSEGFTPGRLENPDQGELPLPPVPRKAMSNFAFLQAEWPDLHESAGKSEPLANGTRRLWMGLLIRLDEWDSSPSNHRAARRTKFLSFPPHDACRGDAARR